MRKRRQEATYEGAVVHCCVHGIPVVIISITHVFSAHFPSVQVDHGAVHVVDAHVQLADTCRVLNVELLPEEVGHHALHGKPAGLGQVSVRPVASKPGRKRRPPALPTCDDGERVGLDQKT